MTMSPVTEIIEELKSGRMVVLLDDEDRENEGDLVMAAEHVCAEDINFMAKHGRGLICLTLTQSRCRQLDLPLMVHGTHQRQSTNFTVSIEAAEGVTTGISAGDRATTIRAAVKEDAKASDIVQPGHIFPLMAQRGGVLARGGHTEAGVDLARLAGGEPASVICEIMNEDGTMARLPELKVFAEQHGLKIGTIADLIRYRMENESTVSRLKQYKINTEFGEFDLTTYHDGITDRTHLALVKGELQHDKPTLVRVHVSETLLDCFTDAHRSGSWTLNEALSYIAREGEGVVVVLDLEREADLINNILVPFQTGASGEKGVSRKHYQEELRSYGLGCQILSDLGIGQMRVMGHATKTPAMSGFGLEVAGYVESSREVLKTKVKSIR